MLSSSQQRIPRTPDIPRSPESNIEQSVEIGTDPLSRENATPVPDSFLTEYSFCGDDNQFMTPRGQGTGDISPAEAALDYVVPKDYPKNLGMDNELKLTGSKESFVLAEKPVQYSIDDDLYYLGSNCSKHPKGQLDFSNLTPGDKYEQGLSSLEDSIPKSFLYPELPSPALSTSSTDEKSQLSSTSSSSSSRPRVNPFSEKNLIKKKQSAPPAMEHLTPFCSQTHLTSTSSLPLDYSSAYPGYTGPPQAHSERSFISPYPKQPKPREPIKSHGQTTTDVDGIDEVVTVLRGSFNNAIQYIGSLAGNNFETSSSISFLGRFYFGKHQHEGRRLDTESIDDKVGTFQDFLCDFQSRVWVTYRRGFTCLEGTSLTSDTGWGCMLRTGQMMLATALQIHCFGRGWRRNSHQHQKQFRDVVRLFGDSFEHPFSIHRLLKIGKNHLNKRYGEWYGPSTVAYVLRVCVDEAREREISSSLINVLVKNFVIYTATDCMLFKQDIINLATGCTATGSTGLCAPPSPTKHWVKTLLLVSVRMGADELNHAYRPAIQDFLSSRLCVGIMGGRKRHSLYFTGFQGSKLIHYDPHYCQPVIKLGQEFNTETYVCVKPRKMSFSKMDPSCTFGFYLRCQADLEELILLSTNVGPQKVFEILDGTKDEYLSMIHDPSIKAFKHNESMFDDQECHSIEDIASLEGSDFEYLD